MTVDLPAVLDVPGGADTGVPTTAGAPGRRSPLLVVGLALVGLFALVAVLAPLLASYDPTTISGGAMERPSSRHWLGTDVPGRDLFAQLVYGARASLVVAVVAGALAMLGAVLVGVLPALVGGFADRLADRVVVFLLALPAAPLLVLVGALAPDSRLAVILVIAFVGVAPHARPLRAQAMTLRQRGFVSSARGFGGGPLYVVRRHLVPALAPLVLAGFVNWASVAVGLEAGLTFLGLGDPSAISWGLTLNRALSQPGIYFSPMWTWWVLPAGAAITLAVLGLTFVGVALEPFFNPRARRQP